MSADQPRDWDKELAEIDKIMGKGPVPAPSAPVPAGAAPRPARSAPAALPAAAPASRKDALAVWLRVLLAAGLAVGMTQWPYDHGCGTSLYLYLGAAGMVILAGVWSAVSSWRRRLGVAHIVSLLVALTGTALVADVVLPRVGYAKRAAAWMCP